MKVVERDETMTDWMVVQKVGEKADWMIGPMVE